MSAGQKSTLPRTTMITPKKGWVPLTRKTDPLIYEVFLEVVTEAKDKGFYLLKDNPKFYWGQETYNLGTCFYHKENKEWEVAIVISHYLKDAPLEKLRSLGVHEVAHACTIGEHHNEIWRKTSREIGKRWGIVNDTPNCKDRELFEFFQQQKRRSGVGKYQISCPCCGRNWVYQRKTCAVQYPSKCTCPCGHKGLKVKKL